MNTEEVWKPVKGYEGLYLVSNLGRVKSLDKICPYRLPGFTMLRKGRILKPNLKPTGYYECSLTKDGKLKSFRVHRLVAESFIPNPNNYETINHINEIKADNRVENLEWCTVKRNIECYHENRIQLYQYTKEGKLLKVWQSATKAAISINGDKTGIQHCCKGKLKTYKGYIWTYTPFSEQELLRRNTDENKQRVGQYTEDDVLLNIYSSFSEAGRAVHCTGGAINMCCDGQRHLIKGYKWKRL